MISWVIKYCSSPHSGSSSRNNGGNHAQPHTKVKHANHQAMQHKLVFLYVCLCVCCFFQENKTKIYLAGEIIQLLVGLF